MRRFPVLVALLVLLMPLVLAPAARAQEATPPATFPATLGLPELRITITDTGFDAPNEIAAGRVLLTVANAASATQESADANLVLLPDGTTIDDVAAFFGPQMATPSSMEEAAPDWIYEATFAGGPIVPPGQSVQAVVDLMPGEWVLLNDSPGAPQQPPLPPLRWRSRRPTSTSSCRSTPLSGWRIRSRPDLTCGSSPTPALSRTS
jgi:hypothetical protein